MTREESQSRNFVVREATEADLPILVDFQAKLALHVIGAAPKRLKKDERNRLMEVLRSALKDPEKLLVVAEMPDTGVVGMGYIYVWRNQGIWEQAGEADFKSGLIDDVWIEPDFRGLGLFNALMHELLAFAESHGVHELMLEYAVSNKEAEAAWSKLGFQVTGVRAAAPTARVRDALSGRGE